MNTLEEEVVRPLQRQIEAQSSLFSQPPFQARPSYFWKYFTASGLALMFGVALTCLIVVERQFSAGIDRAIGQFQWVVLANGDSLAIDEVGRYLKKIDGVSDVTFVTNEDILEMVKKDSMLASDLDKLDYNPFPAAWRVHWNVRQFKPLEIQKSLEDVRVFPAVSDVVYDPSALGWIQSERNQWQPLRKALLLLAFVGGLFGFILLLRCAISPVARKFDAKVFGIGVFIALFSMAVGSMAALFLW